MIRNLQRRNARRHAPDVVLEGVRLVEAALEASASFQGAIASPELDATERGRILASALVEAGCSPELVDRNQLAELADTDTPQGILAVVTPPVWRLGDIAAGRGAPVLVLDGVQDPGNVGALIRTAQALGAAGVVLLPGTAHLSHPKVLRSSMGATFRFPAVRATDEEFRAWLDDTGVSLVTLVTDGDPPGRGAPAARAIMVGNEGAGIRRIWTGRADARWSIAMAPAAESLNVAVAAGIILYEVQRAS